ncbi:MAG TPA: hypothetical protein VEC99_16885 [Clostridia bacterium]|nr:hypothetical protein [Clostridia bacterium]
MRSFNVQLFCGLMVLGLCFPMRVVGQTVTNSPAQTNSIQAEMDSAIRQVEKIVNQPVAAYRVGPGMSVSTYREGWFHEGAIKPDFNNVDVRTTRETPYDEHEYVTSSLNPGIVFVGRQLEFNAMTKYFYTNRTIPKKKLTEAEMVEINRLYRIIGRCEQELEKERIAKLGTNAVVRKKSRRVELATESEKRPRLLNPYIGGGAIVGLGLVWWLSRKLRG